MKRITWIDWKRKSVGYVSWFYVAISNTIPSRYLPEASDVISEADKLWHKYNLGQYNTNEERQETLEKILLKYSKYVYRTNRVGGKLL